jgi:serine phosphatase RsbU (regulator of sigma subunit)
VCDMGNSCVGILVADASGSGLSATLVTAVAKMAFDTFRQNEYSPKAILEKMKKQSGRTVPSQLFT